MRAQIHRAIGWRADNASLSMWTQLAARTVAVTVTFWAVQTLALVWFWTGHYGGPAAHRYFARWMLTWFFTEEIPLPFGSVPYRGGRYTIPSMYRFLCYKYYFGGSFPGWFWHYAWWGLFLTLLIMAAIIVVLFGPERDPTEDRYVRGADVTSTRRLGRALAGDGIEIGGIRIPRMLEAQHFLFVGAPGSGKSTAIQRILRQIEARGETAVVVRGRKRGLCAVLGFQAITQLRAIYGHEQTATLAAAPATKLILRTGEAETARWSSAQIGEREVSRAQIGTNTGLRDHRDSFSVHPHRVTESAVLGSEIQLLPPFEGYLCITGHHRARVTIPYLPPVRRETGFVLRITIATPNESRAAGNDSREVPIRTDNDNGTAVRQVAPAPNRLRA